VSDTASPNAVFLLTYNLNGFFKLYLVRWPMDILTGWKNDGTLIVRCGDAIREIPEAELLSQINANQEKRKGASSGCPVGLRFTLGKPAVVVEGIKVADENYASVKTFDEMKAEIERAVKEEGSSDELLLAWHSDEEIPVGDVRAFIDAQRARNLVVQLLPIFPVGWKA